MSDDNLLKAVGPYSGKCLNGPLKGKTITSQNNFAMGYLWDWAHKGWLYEEDDNKPVTLA